MEEQLGDNRSNALTRVSDYVQKRIPQFVQQIAAQHIEGQEVSKLNSISRFVGGDAVHLTKDGTYVEQTDKQKRIDFITAQIVRRIQEGSYEGINVNAVTWEDDLKHIPGFRDDYEAKEIGFESAYILRCKVLDDITIGTIGGYSTETETRRQRDLKIVRKEVEQQNDVEADMNRIRIAKETRRRMVDNFIGLLSENLSNDSFTIANSTIFGTPGYLESAGVRIAIHREVYNRVWRSPDLLQDRNIPTVIKRLVEMEDLRLTEDLNRHGSNSSLSTLSELDTQHSLESIQFAFAGLILMLSGDDAEQIFIDAGFSDTAQFIDQFTSEVNNYSEEMAEILPVYTHCLRTLNSQYINDMVERVKLQISNSVSNYTVSVE